MLRTFRITINNEEYQVQVEEITGKARFEKNTAVQSVPKPKPPPYPKRRRDLAKNNASPGRCCPAPCRARP